VRALFLAANVRVQLARPPAHLFAAAPRAAPPMYRDVFLWLLQDFGVFPLAILRFGAFAAAAAASGRPPPLAAVLADAALHRTTVTAVEGVHAYVYACPAWDARVAHSDLVFYAVHEHNPSPRWRGLLRLQRFLRTRLRARAAQRNKPQ
jgi:hypothetical protein